MQSMLKNIKSNSSSKGGIKDTIFIYFTNMMICILDLILFQISPPSHTCPFTKGAHAFLYVMISFLM